MLALLRAPRPNDLPTARDLVVLASMGYVQVTTYGAPANGYRTIRDALRIEDGFVYLKRTAVGKA